MSNRDEGGGFRGLDTTHAWILDSVGDGQEHTHDKATLPARVASSTQAGTGPGAGGSPPSVLKTVAELWNSLKTGSKNKKKSDRFVDLDGSRRVAWRHADGRVICVEDPDHPHDSMALWSSLFAIIEEFGDEV